MAQLSMDPHGPFMDTKRILLVDDDDLLRELMCMVLETEGYELVECTDGRQGLDALRGGRFDLLIVDLRMPVMDGARFLAEAGRSGAELPPVIVFSGNSDQDVYDTLAGLPVRLVLRKPVDPDAMLEAIRSLI